MRPVSLDEVVGQAHLAGPDGLLRRLATHPLPSFLLHGPPGSGKTTLARLFAESTGARFVPFSAVLSGVPDLRRAVEAAELARRYDGRPTILFVDEIHRWNKAQQDALLPHVESGLLALVGATTENVGFQVIPPLRSRCRVFRLERLGEDDLVILLARALQDVERGLGDRRLRADSDVLTRLARAADGDARRALGLLEDVARGLPDGGTVDRAALEAASERGELVHDRDGDAHYDVLSAFIKSMRGSDPDAALYWLARLLAAGEPPEGIARRVVIFAAEDVGNADPRSLEVAVAAARGVEMVGLPEARILLAQAVTWCTSAPKSKASYLGLAAALARVQETGSLPVPLHLRNAPTALTRAEGHGEGYLDPHAFPGHVVRQAYRPPEVASDRYYEPTDLGAEKVLAERLAYWRQLLSSREGGNGS
ncbi:MAG: replication-associated recombination protein A [Deltaproteobacteria bacterium]|nr:replication-associated recombination protein A [Deltaproteobacteria bacterium]